MGDYGDDVDDIDVENYKGIYYGDENDDKKLHDDVTGAHF